MPEVRLAGLLGNDAFGNAPRQAVLLLEFLDGDVFHANPRPMSRPALTVLAGIGGKPDLAR
jgi:hypothetical protein